MNTIRFYDENAEAFFDRNVSVDMATGWKAFVELLPTEASGRLA
jgi:hypothetical protein